MQRHVWAVLGMLALVPGAAIAGPMGFIDNFYVEGYGGLRLANNLDYDGYPYDLDPGSSFGATLGLMTTIPGLSFDIDAMQVNSNYTGYTDDPLNSTSLMVDVNYEAMLNDTFGAFAGVGVGIIYLDYYHEYDTGYGAGFQLRGGVSAKLNEQITLFSQVKYQGAIGGSIWVSGTDPLYPIEYNTTSVQAGLRISMP